METQTEMRTEIQDQTPLSFTPYSAHYRAKPSMLSWLSAIIFMVAGVLSLMVPNSFEYFVAGIVLIIIGVGYFILLIVKPKFGG